MNPRLLLLLTLIPNAGCVYAPASWSPAGSELALVTQAGDGETLFPEGWIWGIPQPVKADPVTTRQIWVVQLDPSRWTLVAESKGFCSAPSWSPGGDSLLWVEWTPTDDPVESPPNAPGKLELVRHFPDGPREVLTFEEGIWPRDLIERLPGRTAAWSPDGRFVAFPWLGSSNLKVMEVATRGLVAEWPSADYPSWSPGGEWLALFDRGLERGIRIIPTGSWSTSLPLVKVTGLVQPVPWESMGDSFLLVRSPAQNTPGERSDLGIPRRVQQPKPWVTRVHVPDLSVEYLGALSRPGQRDPEASAWSLAFDEVREVVHVAIAAEAAPARVEALAVSEQSSLQRDASGLLVASLPNWGTGGLSLSPNGKHLAFRYGPPDISAPLALLDLDSKEYRTVAPTMSMRMRALRTLVRLLTQHLARPDRPPSLVWNSKQRLHSPEETDLSISVPTPLALFDPAPALSSPPKPMDSATRAILDEIVTLVAEAPVDQRTPALASRLCEVELLAEYVQGHFDRALVLADRVVSLAQPPLPSTHRHLLAMVRVQCLAALKRKEAAQWEARELARAIEKEKSQIDPSALPTKFEQVNEEIAKRLLAVEGALELPPVRSDGGSLRD